MADQATLNAARQRLQQLKSGSSATATATPASGGSELMQQARARLQQLKGDTNLPVAAPAAVADPNAIGGGNFTAQLPETGLLKPGPYVGPLDVAREAVNIVGQGEMKVGAAIGAGAVPFTKEYQDLQASRAGEQDMQNKLIAKIHELRANGQDASRLEALLKQQGGQPTPSDVEINPALKMSTRQVIGGGIQTALDAATAGTYGKAAAGMKAFEMAPKVAEAAGEVASKAPTVFGKFKAGVKAMGVGAAGGYGYDVSQHLQDNKQGAEAFTPGLGTALGAAVPAVGAVGERFSAEGRAAAAANHVDQAIEDGVSKGIKPTVIGKKTLQGQEEFYGKAKNAVKTIAENRSNLNITDVNGEAVDKPQTMGQFAQAIDQTKKEIFKQYNEMSQSATGKMAQADVTPAIEKLAKASSDIKLNPEERAYALRAITEVKELMGASPDVLESRIADYNSTLNDFYAGRGVSKAKARIDASVAFELRRIQDEMISRLEGEGYSQLKKKYGDLRTIEGEVNKRALVEARKNAKGLADLTDIFTGGEVLSGILNLNPASVVKGGIGFGIKQLYKHLNNPDRYIKNMFEEVYKVFPEAGPRAMPPVRDLPRLPAPDSSKTGPTIYVPPKETNPTQINRTGVPHGTFAEQPRNIPKNVIEGEIVKTPPQIKKVYHGSATNFDEFDPKKLSTIEKDRASKAGFWFSDSKTTAKSYGKNVKEASLDFKNPMSIDANGASYGDFRQELEDAIDQAKKAGNDGLIIKNFSDRKDWGNYEPTTHYVVFDKNAINTNLEPKRSVFGSPAPVSTPKITSIDKFEKADSLSPKDRAVETAAFKKVLQNEDKILADYTQKYGKVINTDNFRQFFDGYNGTNAAAVQEPASYLAKRARAEALKNPEPFATVLAGGSGVGKTSAVKNVNQLKNTMRNSAMIFDGNLSTMKSAEKVIKEAEAAGKIVNLVYTYRDPTDSIVNGVVKRMLTNAEEKGRLVPTKVVANNHIGSWEVIKQLHERGYDIAFIDNSLGPNNAKLVSYEDLAKKIKYPSEPRLRQAFNREVKKLYDTRQITKKQYEGYTKG